MSSYILKFWVGLMDGDGSIQVNHWRHTSLQFRFVIKMKNVDENVVMLEQIRSCLGGRVRKDSEFVVWVLDDRKIIQKYILPIFKKFPPLTCRLNLQLKFLVDCLEHRNIRSYLLTRGLKYKGLNQLNILKDNLLYRNYFNEWLSGFIEAGGCFCLRLKSSKSSSFCITQKHDKHLLEMIRDFFNSSIKIREARQDFYVFETFNKKTIKQIIDHLDRYPLLGFKQVSYMQFRRSVMLSHHCDH
jgi:hypothetical protein